ncbi:MAG TPA: MBL fold metallo-hydrolase [Myxococcales bacterium]|nr:MBL fold metallo-hydrolase [Myxococcales bacterium]
MARLNLRLKENAPGPLYVDETCIDCDTCRQMAPEIYGETRSLSYVMRQPESPDEKMRALQALVACPTASIGGAKGAEVERALETFPQRIAGPVYDCGLRAESSYGATSYLVVRPQGNVLVDSPRAAMPLLRRIDTLGGVRLNFLTHRDDVADHAKIHARFSCDRVLHRADVSGGTRDVEIKLEGEQPVELAPGLIAIPVPGHTRGSSALLVDDEYLFTGDHLWAEGDGSLGMSRGVCWYSWDAQVRSLEKLLAFRFRWVLPGHGRRLQAATPEEMRARVSALLRRVAA